MAMKFVRDNIQYFGGDPDNISLMGHSSGASSVGLHCVAESSKGLFHKAVLMSGSPVGRECDVVQLDWMKRLAEKLGYNGDLENDKDVLDFLNNIDIIKMAAAGYDLATKDEKKKLGIQLNFAPHKELYGTDSTFMLESPVDLMRNSWSNDIDIMIGGTKNEGKVHSDINYADAVPVALLNPREGPKLDELVAKFQELYEAEFGQGKAAYEEVRLKNLNKIINFIYFCILNSSEVTHFVGLA